MGYVGGFEGDNPPPEYIDQEPGKTAYMGCIGD